MIMAFIISHSRGMIGWKEKWEEKLTKNYQRDIPWHRTSCLAIKLGCGEFARASHCWALVSNCFLHHLFFFTSSYFSTFFCSLFLFHFYFFKLPITSTHELSYLYCSDFLTCCTERGVLASSWVVVSCLLLLNPNSTLDIQSNLEKWFSRTRFWDSKIQILPLYHLFP